MPIRKDKLPEWTPHLHTAICLSFSLGFWWDHQPTINRRGANDRSTCWQLWSCRLSGHVWITHVTHFFGSPLAAWLCYYLDISHTWPPCEMMPCPFVTLHWCGGTAPHRSVESVHNHPERGKTKFIVICSQVVKELDWKIAVSNPTSDDH